MFKRELKISKVQDQQFRFCGVDVALENGVISLSLEEYAKTVKPIPIRKGKRSETLTYEEHMAVKRVCGQIGWLAAANRPDLAFAAMKLATYTNKSTLKDLRYVNLMVEKVQSRDNIMKFEKIGKTEDLIVYGFADASFKFGEKAVGGQYILMGAKGTNKIQSLFWKSKMIRKVVRNAKEAETVNLGTVVDMARHTANQLGQLLFWGRSRQKNLEVEVFIDNAATLDSIASSKQVERRLLRNDVEYLKQMLEFGEIASFKWIQDELMISDVLTKDKKQKIGLDDILARNRLDVVTKDEDKVVYHDGEFSIKGSGLRRRLSPKPKMPKRKRKKLL